MVQCLLLPTPGTDEDLDVLDIHPCAASRSWVQGARRWADRLSHPRLR